MNQIEKDALKCCEDIFYDFSEEELDQYPTSIKMAWELGEDITLNSYDIVEEKK